MTLQPLSRPSAPPPEPRLEDELSHSSRKSKRNSVTAGLEQNIRDAMMELKLPDHQYSLPDLLPADGQDDAAAAEWKAWHS